jgi:hypothetical protein
MGLYRTALRLATIESLRPASLLDTQGPWPTLAGPRVYDSRIDPIEDLKPGLENRRAVIVVYAEADQGYSAQKRGGPAFRREVDLVFEISQIAADGAGDDYVAGYASTDSELEAELDRIEWEISNALYFARNGTLIARSQLEHDCAKPGETLMPIWRALTGEAVTEPRSHPHRTSEEAVRLAYRTVTWKVQCPDDHWPTLAPAEAITGLDSFPYPFRGVAKALAQVPAYAPLINGLVTGAPTPAVTPRLQRVGLNIEIIPPGQTKTGNANMSALVGLPLWTRRS